MTDYIEGFWTDGWRFSERRCGQEGVSWNVFKCRNYHPNNLEREERLDVKPDVSWYQKHLSRTTTIREMYTHVPANWWCWRAPFRMPYKNLMRDVKARTNVLFISPTWIVSNISNRGNGELQFGRKSLSLTFLMLVSEASSMGFFGLVHLWKETTTYFTANHLTRKLQRQIAWKRGTMLYWTERKKMDLYTILTRCGISILATKLTHKMWKKVEVASAPSAASRLATEQIVNSKASAS